MEDLEDSYSLWLNAPSSGWDLGEGYGYRIGAFEIEVMDGDVVVYPVEGSPDPRILIKPHVARELAQCLLAAADLAQGRVPAGYRDL